MSTINFEKAIEYIKNLPATPNSNLTPIVIIKWDKTKTFRTKYGGKIVEKSPVFYYPKTGKVKFLERAPAKYKHDYLFDNCEDMRFPYRTNKKISVTSAKKEIFSYYGKYHKEIDALEIASVVMKGTEPKMEKKEHGNILTLIMKDISCSKTAKLSKAFPISRRMESFTTKLFVTGYSQTFLKIFITDILTNKLWLSSDLRQLKNG